jgi:hypothetical protein
MAKVPLPERGQPIDVSYIYQLTNAINQISDQLTSVGYNYTTIDTPSAGRQNVETANARIIGGSVVVTSNSTQAADSTKQFNYSYNGNFKYRPIVTATVVNTGGDKTAGDGATVVITNVDENALSGIVRFDKSGKASVSVNLIIVGIPAK